MKQHSAATANLRGIFDTHGATLAAEQIQASALIDCKRVIAELRLAASALDVTCGLFVCEGSEVRPSAGSGPLYAVGSFCAALRSRCPDWASSCLESHEAAVREALAAGRPLRADCACGNGLLFVCPVFLQWNGERFPKLCITGTLYAFSRRATAAELSALSGIGRDDAQRLVSEARRGALPADRLAAFRKDIESIAGSISAEISSRYQLCREVAARTRAQEELERETDELRLYRKLLDNVDDVVLMADRQGRILAANKKAQEVLGYADQELRGLNASVLHPRSDWDNAFGIARDAYKNRIAKGEARLLTKDGRTVDTEFSLRYSPEEETYQAIFRDISERKRAEQVLRQSEATNRALVTAMPDLLFQITADGVFVATNRASDDRFYLPPGQFLGRPVAEVLPPDLADQTMRNVKRALETGQMQTYEYSLPVGGGPRVFEARVLPSGDEMVLAIVRDITEQRRAEEALRIALQSRKELEAVINKSPVVVFLWGAEPGWPIEFVSDNISQFGYSAEDLISGRVTYDRILHPDDLDRVADEIRMYSSECCEEFTQQYRIVTKSGEARWVHDRTWIVRGSDDIIERYQGIVMDITEQLRMENELRRRTQQLELQNRRVLAANESRTRFFASMSHEFRTPLTSIIGFGELMAEDRNAPLSAEQRGYLAKVQQNARQLLEMVNDLLDISKAESGRISVHLSQVDVKSLIEDVVAGMTPVLRREDVAMHVDIQDDMPVVTTDAQKLGQILTNLLSNALKFTNQGSVSVSAVVADGQLRIAVKDTGIGIRRADIRRIFQEFEQAGGPDGRKIRGTGLGLPLAKRLCYLLGGRIKVQSEVGKGSTFTVLLPVSLRESAVRRRARALGSGGAAPPE